MWLYNALLLVLAPIWGAALLFGSRTRAELGERLRPLERRTPAARGGVVWIHAASVGEVEGVAPVIAELEKLGTPLLLTTMTRSGRDRARARFPALPVRLAPLDLRPLLWASMRCARVAALVLMETELWPNYLDVARRARVPCAIANARISDRSLKRYRWLRWLLARPLSAVQVLARSATDAERFVSLGADPARTRAIGDLKLDATPPAVPAALRESVGPGPLWVAGSTHPGEERILIEHWRALRARVAPGLRLVLVPRHAERAAEVLALASQAGARAALRSAADPDAELVVVDTVGELSALYALADLVYVGGSLVPVGGHNLLEPLRAGRVSVCGPHLENQRSQTALLEGTGALHVVGDERELGERLVQLWREGDRHAPARALRERVLGSGGSTREIVDWIRARTGPGGP